jgi:hypothetical protein
LAVVLPGLVAGRGIEGGSVEAPAPRLAALQQVLCLPLPCRCRAH